MAVIDFIREYWQVLLLADLVLFQIVLVCYLVRASKKCMRAVDLLHGFDSAFTYINSHILKCCGMLEKIDNTTLKDIKNELSLIGYNVSSMGIRQNYQAEDISKVRKLIKRRNDALRVNKDL